MDSRHMMKGVLFPENVCPQVSTIPIMSILLFCRGCCENTNNYLSLPAHHSFQFLGTIDGFRFANSTIVEMADYTPTAGAPANGTNMNGSGDSTFTAGTPMSASGEAAKTLW